MFNDGVGPMWSYQYAQTKDSELHMPGWGFKIQRHGETQYYFRLRRPVSGCVALLRTKLLLALKRRNTKNGQQQSAPYVHY